VSSGTPPDDLDPRIGRGVGGIDDAERRLAARDEQQRTAYTRGWCDREVVRDHGSISAAGRSMGMSYRRP